MKKLLITLVLMTAAVVAQAQHEKGSLNIQPRVGMALAKIGDLDWKPGIAFGVELEQFVTDKFSVAEGLAFINQGTKFKDFPTELDHYYSIHFGKDMNMNHYYIAIPVTASYYVLPGLAVKAGLQPAFRVGDSYKQDGKKLDTQEVLDWMYLLNPGTKLNNFDLSIPVGLSYEFHNITLDARYNIGLTKITKIDSSHNQVFVFTLGYKFEL